MPIYEYRCRQCRRKTTTLVLSFAQAGEVRCSACGSGDLERLWSRFATVRSEESRLDALGDPSGLDGLDESDPKSMTRWMKRMGQEMGEDAGEDLEQAFEEEIQAAGTGDETDDSKDTDPKNDG